MVNTTKAQTGQTLSAQLSSLLFGDYTKAPTAGANPGTATVITSSAQPTSGINAGTFQPYAVLVYDAAAYGKDLNIDLAPTDMSVQTFTVSSGVFKATVESFNPGSGSVNYIPILHTQELYVSNDDTGAILHAGNNTAFNKNFLFEADMTAAVHQIQVNFAVGLNVSAYTNGSATINNVTITLQPYQQNSQPIDGPAQVVFTPSTSFTALTATGTQVFVVRGYIDGPFKMRLNGPMLVNVTVNTTISGTNTSQVGIIPLFPLISNAITKKWYPSQMVAHLHVLPEHIQELNAQTNYWLTGSEPNPNGPVSANILGLSAGI